MHHQKMKRDDAIKMFADYAWDESDFTKKEVRSLLCDIKDFLASTTATATTTPQIKNLIGRVRKNKRAARAARTYEQVRAVLCKTTT